MGGLFKNDINIKERKLEHIKIILEEDISHHVSTWFEYVHLIHNSLPELSLDKIDMTTSFLGRRFSYPILIDSMTGGVKGTEKINKALAELASKYKIPMSCGSEKAAIKDPEIRYTYRIIRNVSSDIYLIGNIGAHDLKEDPKRIAEEVVSIIEADALAIHLNPLQEAIQTGYVDYEDVIKVIEKTVDYLDIPVIVKETGAGISFGVAKILESIGVSAINIAGVGGTSWSAVEAKRHLFSGNKLYSSVGNTFWDWGIPTAASLIEVVNSVDIPVIASGGIRNGLDILKSLVLGASLAGMAAPFLKALYEGEDELRFFIEKVILELRIGMFLVGSSSIRELKDVQYVLLSPLRDWALQRGVLKCPKGICNNLDIKKE